ncbi:uncharacterized protein A1O5_03493 [Cladophialophora psammophila CBS 110553]|uniref:Mid2 domain-containing protein n=1 Tax=Cladophialophora psammophila CBS 110553 TaxID=1182543 RepID=W9X9X2_9EURO|nr:uncharacterized protein A1O5_03493 [Cladophialophora psammophila CBS 110553]EXJ73731.1 hypothetical protein A1O5_03493 [Cladophialophora psammophila CBS 110553]
MGRQGLLYVLALSIFLCFCNALPSVPVATDPILSTLTVSTVVPSLVTVYSVVPATDAAPNALATITTTIDGLPTTVTSTAVVAGSITSTIVSTVSLTTNQVVVSIIGYSTVFGPDPIATTTASSVSPATAASTSDTPSLTITSASETLPTTASVQATSASTTSSDTSTALAFTANQPSSSAAVTGTSAPSQASHSSSSSKGLTAGAKAGIGIGVAIGVILLVILSFLLGQRYSRRLNGLAKANTDLTGADEKDIFQAGRPYESTGSKHHSLGLSATKGPASSMNTTAIGSGSESVSGRSYDMPLSDSSNNRVNNPELSALPPIENEDQPMYVGVPSHMSGSKRWSMKEYMK